MALTETRIRAARPTTKRLKLSDDHGLYLLMAPSGGRWWRLRITVAGREQHVSLGRYPEVSLDAARARAAQLRLAKDGGTAVLANLAAEIRGAARPHPVREKPKGSALERVAEAWLEHQSLAASTHKRNARIVRHLVKALGASKPIDAIDRTALRDAVLQIQENNGRETAHRALNFAADIWRYAEANGLDDRRQNPAEGLRSKDILRKPDEQRLPAITQPVQFGELLRAIDNYSGQPVTRLSLQILPHLFTRPSELRLAHWSEFERAGNTLQWIVPAERTKMRRDLLVPLSTQVLGLLAELERHRKGELLFQSLRPDRPISENTLNMALRNLGYDTQKQHCAHGFRSSASSLLRERCGQSAAVIEVQLAHKKPGVGGVYDRAEYIEQRRTMMQVWSDYLEELRRNVA